MIRTYSNLTNNIGSLGDVDISTAVVGDTLVLGADNIWRAQAGGGGGGGISSIVVNSNFFSGNGTTLNPLNLIESGISHVNLSLVNGDSNVQHLTAAQVLGLHSAVTVSNDSNSVVSLAVDSNQVMSVAFSYSNFTLSHTSLTSPNGNSNIQHLTAAQVSGLHSAVTVSNVGGAALSLSVDSNQVLSGSIDSTKLDVTGQILTGLSPSAGVITASDSILTAFNKTQGSISTLEAKNVRATRFVSIGSGTSGTITIPANNSIILDSFGGTVDAVVSATSGGRPTFESVLTAGGAVVGTTFDALGNYTLSGTPAAYPVAIVYRTRCALINYDDTAADIAGEKTIESDHNALVNVQGGTGGDHQHLTTAQVAQVNIISSTNLPRVATVAALKALTGTVNSVVFCIEKEAIYSYCPNCAYTADDDLVTITGDGGNTRWEMLQKMSRTQGDTGWINTDNATLSALSATQTRLSITSTAVIAIKGVRISVPIANYDITLSGAAGPKFIGFNDSTLVLSSQDSLWDFNAQVPVAVVYWSGTAIVAAPQTEFHGVRDTVWHTWAHKFIGTQYVSGLAFTGNVQVDNNTNPGANDTVSYLWSTTGVIQDEDVQSSPGTGQWLQTLGSGLTSATAAIFNYFYFNGTFVTTQAAMADRTPFIHAGAGTPPQWENAGVLTPAVSNDFIVYHYFATPMTGGWAIFARPHNAKFTSLALAQAARPSQLTWSNYAEIKHLYTAIFRVNTTWDNTHKCKLVRLDDYRTVAGTPTAAVNPTSHSALSALELAGPGVTYGHVDDQAQIIAGVKTFTSSPELPGVLATTANQAVSKSYVDIKTQDTNFVINRNAEFSRTADITFGAGVVAPGDGTPAIDGTYSFLLSGVATAASNTWWQWGLTAIPSFYAGKPLSFSLKTSTAASGEFRVSVYNVTDAVELTETRVTVPAGAYEAKGFFIPVDGKAYGLRITQITNGVASLLVDSLYVGDVPVRYGQAVTDWQSYTPSTTLGFGSVTAGAFFWKRVGDSIDIQAIFTVGTPTSDVARIGLPTGLTVGLITSNLVGKFVNNVSGANAQKQGTILASAGNAHLNFGLDDTALGIAPLASVSGTGIALAGMTFSFFARVPIVGWSSNIQLADRALEEFASNSSQADADDTTSFVYGPNGSPMQGATLNANRLRRCRFQNAIQPTDVLIFEYWDSIRWVPLNGYGLIQGVEYFAPFDYAGSFGVGQIRGVSGSTTDIEVIVGRYARGTTNWPAALASTGKWRVRKVSGGAQVGFPVSAANIIGQTMTPASGYIGETISASGDVAPASGVYGTMASVTLTAGVWLITAGAYPSANASYVAANQSAISIKIGATSGTNYGTDFNSAGLLTANYGGPATSLVRTLVIVAGTKTAAIEARAAFSAGGVTWYGSINAVRIA